MRARRTLMGRNPHSRSDADTDEGCGDMRKKNEDAAPAAGDKEAVPAIASGTSFHDRLGALVEAGDECGVFALGNCLAEVQEAVVRDGVLCLETSSSYAHRVLGQNIAVVTSLVEDVTGFHGKVEVLLKQVEEDTHDPLLDTLAKAFRGQIIMERDEEGR